MLSMLMQVSALYIAELSPKHLRGKLVSMVATGAAFGNLMAALLNVGVEGVVFGWRVSLGLQFVVTCILIIGSSLIPPSPRWLVQKNKAGNAHKILKKIYKDDDVALSNLNEISCSFQKSQYNQQLWKACCTRDIFFRVFLGFSVLFFGRVNGMQLALYFSASIFCKIGISGFVGGVLIGVAICIAQLSLFLVADKVRFKFFLF